MAEKSPKHYVETQRIGGTTKTELKKGDTIHVAGGESGLSHLLYSKEIRRLNDGSEYAFGKFLGFPTHRRISTVVNGRAAIPELRAPMLLGGEQHFVKVETA